MRIRKLGDLITPTIEFAKDVQLAEEAVDEKDTSYFRRNYVRALFAMIEGVIYALKQTALARGLSDPGMLAISEVALLKEESFDLNGKGEPYSQTKFLRTSDNLRFTSICIYKIFDCQLELGVGTKEWENFLKAIKIRNRITHPKSSEDFEVSRDEVELIRQVSCWFNDLTAKAVEGITKKIFEPNKSLDRSARSES